MNTQAIPPASSLLPKMPSGREIHTVKPYQVPVLDKDALEAMRCVPDREDDVADNASSDDDGVKDAPAAPGTFPGTADAYGTARATSGNAYY